MIIYGFGRLEFILCQFRLCLLAHLLCIHKPFKMLHSLTALTPLKPLRMERPVQRLATFGRFLHLGLIQLDYRIRKGFIGVVAVGVESLDEHPFPLFLVLQQ